MTVDFRQKNKRACTLEKEYLPSFYQHIADGWELAQGTSLLVLYVQTRVHIDAVITRGGKAYGVDHKFVFYDTGRPGGRNVTLETKQNSIHGTPGWTHTTRADYILFAFEPAPGQKELDVYLVPWRKLKTWLSERGRFYRLYLDQASPNKPEFRIVPIAHIERAIPETRRYVIRQDEQGGGYTCLEVKRASQRETHAVKFTVGVGAA